MKTKVLSVVMLFVIGTMSVFAQSKTEKFKVYGNCGMCENRIENAAKSVDGVSSADWNQETKMFEVSFDSLKTNVHKVHMAIAKAGHDTDLHKTNNETYNNLPGCCKYDRPKGKTELEKHDGHSH